jgi:hypothetical protein
MCADIGTVVAVRAPGTHGRVVVPVVPGRDMYTERIECAVCDTLHRRRQYVGGCQPDAARDKAGDRGRGHQLEARPARLPSPGCAQACERPVGDTRKERRRTKGPQPALDLGEVLILLGVMFVHAR